VQSDLAPPLRRTSAAEGQALALSIVSPTYCERDNIKAFVAAVAEALGPLKYEIIFVDDDSPDGTAGEIIEMARNGAPVRCIRRIGRRGLSSAVVEGILASSSEMVAVMDADLQHDETLLVKMLSTMKNQGADVVVASRHVDGGGVGDFSVERQRMSALAASASRVLIGKTVSDPMSGFFMIRRRVFDEVVYNLAQQGYKILLDILASTPRPLKVVEVPYTFRSRNAGESKLERLIIIEYAFLIIEKVTKGVIPARFVLFASVGALGLCVHLAILDLALRAGAPFLPAQGVATVCAMTSNYFLNNAVTYRAERLTGSRLAVGYVLFCLVCSVGSVANISVADVMMMSMHSWPLAGVAGALTSAVFNFGVTTRFVWGRLQNRGKAQA
jgi:dolichol-phosphate mannosyltransferase